MHHPDVRLLLVTGGPAVVREALKTDKRAITAGPGNPPAVVDETADVEKAGRDIVRGASFDNNVICTDEKDVYRGGHGRRPAGAGDGASTAPTCSSEHELRKLERVIFTELGPPGKPGHINPAWIGKDAWRDPARDRRPGRTATSGWLVAEVPREHSLVWTEQMMPVMPVVRVPNVEQAIDLAVRSEHGFRHTASIHSTNVDDDHEDGAGDELHIFVANGPNFSGLGEGGEGFASFSIASPTGRRA